MNEPRKVRQPERSRSAVLRPDWSKIASDRKKFGELLALVRPMDDEKIKKTMAELSPEEADQLLDAIQRALPVVKRVLAKKKKLRAIAAERRTSKMKEKGS